MPNESAAAASNPNSSSSAVLKSGVRVQKIEAGKTVKEVRAEWSGLFRIPADAKAFSGTTELSEDAVVTGDMTLEFIKKSGEKGIF
jgi:hypothetical protein